MAERPAALNVGQWGPEVTPGVAVAASKRLLCTGFDPDPNVNISTYTPVGFLAPTTAIAGKETTTGAISGVTCVSDLVYLFSSLFRIVAPTTPVGATLSRKWSFKPSVSAIDTFQTYTLEKGTAAQAERMVYAVVNALTMRWTDRDANLSGSLMGQNLVENVTITPTPTDIPAVPLDPKSIAVFVGNSMATNEVQTLAVNAATGTYTISLDGQSATGVAVAASTAVLQSTLEGLSTIGKNNVTVAGTPGTSYTITFVGDLAGLDVSTLVLSQFTGGPPTITTTTPGSMTRLTRDLQFELAIPERYVFPMTLNDADPSFSFVIPKRVEPKAAIIMQHDLAAANLMADLRARTTKYCKILCRGPAIEAGYASYLALSFPFKFTENARSDQNDVYSSTYTLSAVYDPTFAGFIQADVQTAVAAL